MATTQIDPNVDPELNAMMQVFTALKPLNQDAQLRVLEYVEGRLGLQRPLGHSQHSTGADEQVQSQARPRGESPPDEAAAPQPEAPSRVESADHEDLEGISPIASKWMRRNGLTASDVSTLYSLGVDEIDLVANKVPGKSVRERLHNVMLLQGVAGYLSSGAPRIDGDRLRDAMKHYDADPGRNFAGYLSDWAIEIAGSRASGDLTLTTRGLNTAKDLIKQMIAGTTRSA